MADTKDSDNVHIENQDDADIIKVPEACRFLNLHRNTLYKLIQAKEIPAFRLSRGGRWRFRKTELEEWLEVKQFRGGV